MFIGTRFNKGNFESKSDFNIVWLVLTRRRTNTPALS